jgi:pSer/pThr/pTyr-binding forkhead associated (FHA) protein
MVRAENTLVSPRRSRLTDEHGGYPLRGTVTRTGRLAENDIVLDDDTVSRYHAVIVDTGNTLVITDLRSANGVDVGEQRIRGSATLTEGDRICICGHEITFEIAR